MIKLVDLVIVRLFCLLPQFVRIAITKSIVCAKLHLSWLLSARRHQTLKPIQPAFQNILYVTCYLDGSGVSAINFHVLQECRRIGINVHIATTSILPSTSIDWEEKFRTISISLTKLAEPKNPDPIGRLLFLIRSLDINVMFICHSDFIYKNLGAVRSCYKNLRIIDALHTLEPRHVGGGYPDLSACKIINKYLDKTITISNSLRSYIEKHYGVPRAKICVIPNGVDLKQFSITTKQKQNLRTSLGILQTEKIVGFVGRLVGQKDPLLFVNVAYNILARVPNTRFIVVGDGPLYVKMRTKAAKLGIIKYFMWPGAVNTVENWLPVFDLLLLTSQYEGVPLTILEAITGGLPVVSTDVGAIREQCEQYIYLVNTGFRLTQRLTNAAVAVLTSHTKPSIPPDTHRYDIKKTSNAYLDVFLNQATRESDLPNPN